MVGSTPELIIKATNVQFFRQHMVDMADGKTTSVSGIRPVTKARRTYSV